MALPSRAATLVDVARPQAKPITSDVLLVIAFGALMGLLAQISIPLPFTPVPVTGQTFGVIVTGALLGSRRGAAAMAVYVAEGAAGLPVFALARGGWEVLAGPTGGYLLAFPAAAFAVGLLAERGWDRRFATAIAALLLGELIIYAGGLCWLARFVGPARVIPLGLVPFLPGDALKVLAAAALLPAGWRTIHRVPRT